MGEVQVTLANTTWMSRKLRRRNYWRELGRICQVHSLFLASRGGYDCHLRLTRSRHSMKSCSKSLLHQRGKLCATVLECPRRSLSTVTPGVIAGSMTTATSTPSRQTAPKLPWHRQQPTKSRSDTRGVTPNSNRRHGLYEPCRSCADYLHYPTRGM